MPLEKYNNINRYKKLSGCHVFEKRNCTVEPRYSCNPFTNGPNKFGRINEGFLQENVRSFCRTAKEAVIMRWP